MGGKTPFEKLEEVWDGMINKNVVNFPVIVLEELCKEVTSAVLWLSRFKPLSHLPQGGKYLPAKCPILSTELISEEMVYLENRSRDDRDDRHDLYEYVE